MKTTIEEIRTARAILTLIAEPADQKMCELLDGFDPVDALEIARSQTNSLREGVPGRWSRHSIETQDLLIAEFLADEDIRFIIPEDPEWPEQLNDLGTKRPYGLWVRGTENFPPASETVTITGSRDATEYGRTVTADFTAHLGKYGKTIVTGGGYGVEASALQAASAHEYPVITVSARGLGAHYLSGNTDAIERSLTRGGLIVSESPRDTTPTRNLFNARTRLLAALSEVTIIPEARYSSYSIQVAQEAANMGRRVAAVPGSINSGSSAGCHRLIREGTAELTTDAFEIQQSCK